MATTVFLLTFSTVQTTVAGWVTSYLNNTYKVNVNIGTVYFKNLKTIGLGHIYVADHHNDTLLYAQALNVSVETLVLPQNKLFVKKVQVENPKVYLKTYKNETDLNLHIFLQNFATNSDSASSTSFFIHALFFKIKNGAFKYINQNFIRNNQVVDY